MKAVTFELPEEIYDVLQQTAVESGRRLEDVAAEYLARRAAEAKPQLPAGQHRRAMERLLRHAGAVDTGDLHSSENERIDADLARSYEDHHEPKS